MNHDMKLGPVKVIPRHISQYPYILGSLSLAEP